MAIYKDKICQCEFCSEEEEEEEYLFDKKDIIYIAIFYLMYLNIKFILVKVLLSFINL